jgi:hypothetical protein
MKRPISWAPFPTLQGWIEMLLNKARRMKQFLNCKKMWTG